MTWLKAFGGRRAVVWVLPLLLVAANVAWLVALGSGARVRAAELDRRADRARRDHDEVAAALARDEKLWIAATENRRRIDELYHQRLSTERARFTDAVRELKSLAERAGLVPRSISYPEEQLASYGLVRRSFVFSVEGSYAQLRSLLHMLELSRTFFVIEQISVSESQHGLTVRLRLSTLFASGGDNTRPLPETETTPADVETTAPAAATEAPDNDGGTPEAAAPDDEGADG